MAGERLKHLIFSVVTLLLCFFLLEIGLRIAGFQAEKSALDLFNGDTVNVQWTLRGLTRDPDLPWSWIPAPGGYAAIPAHNHFTYNAMGFRGPLFNLQKDSNTIRILCLGDSCTLGWDAPDSGTYPAIMRKMVDTYMPGNYEVINAGVSGYSSYQGLFSLTHRLAKLTPDILIVSFNWNDHGEATRTSDSGDKLSTRIPDKSMPSNNWVTHLQAMAGKSLTYQMLRKGLLRIKYRDQTAPGKRHNTFIPRVSLTDYRKNLEKMAQYASRHNIRIIFFTQIANPVKNRQMKFWRNQYRMQDEYNAAMMETAKKLHVPGIDMKPFLTAPPNPETRWYDHVHLRPEGNKIVAEHLFLEVMNFPDNTDSTDQSGS